MKHRRRTRGLLLALSAVTGAACAPPMTNTGVSTVTPRDARYPAPPPSLVGTASPGDVYRVTVTNGTFQLNYDRGTPANTSDDVIVGGDVASRGGSRPLELTVRSSGDRVRFPIGSVLRALSLPGFGYALELNGVVVTAVTPAPCSAYSTFASAIFGAGSRAYSVFDAAPGTRVDSVRPLTMTGRGSLLAPAAAVEFSFGDPMDAGQQWTTSIAGCDAARNNMLTIGGLRTPYTNAVMAGTAPFPYQGPELASVSGFFTESGALVMDFGLTWGGVIAAPEAPDLTVDAATRAAQLDLRMRARTLTGYLTNVSVFQPMGATREDPSVARSPQSRAFAITIVTDGQSGTMTVSSLSGTMIAQGIPVQIVNRMGSLELRIGGPAGTLALAGLTVDNARGTSFLVSARDASLGRPTPSSPAFDTATSIATPAGSELWLRHYVAQLRLDAPPDCFALPGGATLPDEYTRYRASPVVSMLDRPTDTLSIEFRGDEFGADASRVRATVRSTARTIDVSSQPHFAVTWTGARVELSATAGHKVRLVCGPDYPWHPGPDVNAAVDGADTSSRGNLGLAVPGIYVFESGRESQFRGASSVYYVVEVRPESDRD